MPIGLLIMVWDDRGGADVVARYPEEVDVNEQTLMQIYATHEYSGEAGMISMMVGSLNIASFYTGPESQIYLILLLEIEEDADSYQEGLADAATVVIPNYESDSLDALVPSLFQRISIYPTFTEEQKLINLYQDNAKRAVIKQLRHDSAMLVSEMDLWLKDEHESDFVDVDNLLQSLIKEDVVRTLSVKNQPSAVVYLVHDILLSRAPPVEIYKNCVERGLPQSLEKAYKEEVQTYFKGYKRNEEDILEVIEILLDPQVWEVFMLLRGDVVTKDTILKLEKKGVDEPDRVLKQLYEAKMLALLSDDQGTEYYALLSDMRIKKIFPEYALNIIRKNFNEKTKSPQLLVAYLELFRDNYTELRT